MPEPLVLPAELTIYDVGELRPKWRGWADALRPDVAAKVNCAAVQVVDAAGVQLLLSLSHTLNAGGKSLQLMNVSAALAAACHALGLTQLLPAESRTGAQA